MNQKLGLLGFICVVVIVVLSYGHSSRNVSGQIERHLKGGRVSVLDYGAVGNGKTDDRAAIQAAIDARDEIHFPDVPAFYRVSGSLQIGGSNQAGGKRLIGHLPCRGGGAFQGKPALIHGDGSKTLLVAMGSTPQNRAIEMVGLSAFNEGKPVLDLMSGIDAMLDGCWFRTIKNSDATIRLRESYNVTIRESTISCSGGGFAVTAYQQCNKLRIQNCRLGGGDLGGAAHIEQSANVQLEGNIIELGKYGLVVGSGIRLDQPAAGKVEGAGACHALRVASNYFENVQYPVVLGSAINLENQPGQAIFGAVIEVNNIGTSSFDFPLMTIGRLQAASIRGNSFWRKADGKAAAIHATYSGIANPSHASGCVIEANHLTNGNGPFFGSDDAKIGGMPFSQLLEKDNKITTP